MKAGMTIGVGGAHSGAGKTALIARLLAGPLNGWGAVKCTPTSLYTALIDDPLTLGEPGKDTAIYLSSGASEALWVQAVPEDIGETMDIALARLSHLPGTVIEGNAAIEAAQPDIVILIFGEPGRVKESAVRILPLADLVVGSENGGPSLPERATRVRSGDWPGIIDFVRGAVHGRESQTGTP